MTSLEVQERAKEVSNNFEEDNILMVLNNGGIYHVHAFFDLTSCFYIEDNRAIAELQHMYGNWEIVRIYKVPKMTCLDYGDYSDITTIQEILDRIPYIPISVKTEENKKDWKAEWREELQNNPLFRFECLNQIDLSQICEYLEHTYSNEEIFEGLQRYCDSKDLIFTMLEHIQTEIS